MAGKACDTLLLNANQKLINRDSLISQKAFEIKKLSAIVNANNQLIELKSDEIKDLQGTLDKKVNIIKWLKYGWGSSVVIISGLFTYLTIK